MATLTALQVDQTPRTGIRAGCLNWTENPAVQRLLDVVVSVLADEFIRTTKQNPEAFTDTMEAGKSSGEPSSGDGGGRI